MNIITANRQRAKKINRCLLQQVGAALLAELKVESAELSIQLVTTPEITRLNEKFLRHAGPTDVITFDYANNAGQAFRLPLKPIKRPEDRRDALPAIHGEIFICVDKAVRQARTFGTRWQSEVVRYLIHGVLHLLGFDDASAGARRKMRREENRRLRELSRRFPLSKL
jgi:probable rRNA maturation factor